MKQILAYLLLFLSWVKVWRIQLSFDQLVFGKVHRHVCGKDSPYDLLSQLFELLLGQLAKDIELIFREDLECRCNVEVFKH